MDRKLVVQEARQIMREYFPHALGMTGSCLFWAAATIKAIRRHGAYAELQAGTCFWPRLKPDQPGEMRAYGYQWSLNSATLRWLSMGKLPEMHIWTLIPDTLEIVDMTSGFFPARCMETLNLDWPGDKPPEYFWQKAEYSLDWPEGLQYVADPNATEIATRFIEHYLVTHLFQQ